MKKLIVLSFLFLFLASQAWSQEKCEAPVWKVGDKWTYKDATRATFSTEVLDVKEDVYIVKNEEIQNIVALDKKTMNLKFLIGPDGRKVLAAGVLRKSYDFPLLVGKKWTDNFTYEVPRANAPVTMMCDFKIEDTAEVKTSKGTFKTYVIHRKQGFREYGGNYGWVRYWYSPEIKNWIKREFEKSNYWAQSKMFDAELISYQLK